MTKKTTKKAVIEQPDAVSDELLSIDTIITRAAELQPKTRVVYDSKVLKGKIEIVKIPRRRFKFVTDSVNEKSSDEEQEAAQDLLMYESIPCLQSKELRDSLGIKVPTDIVGRIFGDNLGEISDILVIIYDFFGIDIRAVVAAKKQ